LIEAPEGGLRPDSIALGEQLHAVTRDRLLERWGNLGADSMRRFDRALMIALDLPGQFD
jgi:mRNA-degrading endonuclease toxin of MazEF toxin-antitoxin module